ncbi:MAG TPA: ABC transporter ATP-binding protein [Tepidisphaeraceae bacterium]
MTEASGSSTVAVDGGGGSGDAIPPAVATAGADGAGFSLSEYTVRTIDVKRSYKIGNEEVHALKGVTVSINRGEYISIMGPSGSGKSTLFNMVGGLDKPSEGKVYIDEVDIAQLDSYELAWMRCRKIGYIFQTFNLIPVMTALENVMLPMIFAGMNTADAQDKAADILKRVELGHRLMNKPQEMSGGQQQRVAIARAFANDPAIILADEPTGNLDLQTGKLIIELLRQLNKESGVTIISATHDHKMLAVSDRIIWIRDGKVDKIQKREDLKIEEGTIEGAGGEALH